MPNRTYSRSEPLLTIEEFKKRYLFGVDLTDGNGTQLSDFIIESHINIAIDFIEQTLECPLFPTDFEENLDYKFQEYRQFVYLQLTNYPLVSVDEVKLQVGSTLVIDFPQEWFKIYHNSGQIQMLPTIGTFQSLLFTNYGSGAIAPRALATSYAPQLLKIIGKYGISEEADKLQPTINHAIGLLTAIQVLQFLGDLSASGPGISSSSLGVDGLNQTISTAISATNNLFGATILKYTNILNKTILALLKSTYKRIKLVHI